ncbi:hypothetical protein A2715_00515 [Candidatus Woesebacteria bacterium RIFCSPHIGHO2_01_FULL_39_32]|uniref:SGNH hydrolase-type esterase domain-containing protein n=1 Tax=Candidatus Woesebacteria bacterium RIFCSPLOWO2_01_FULL_39_25 TaxID=1802521 RepID=A0A1F8BQ16_9BACT|nr:MAG: hypothetical protein A2715_00515 [Candidatus Woesebacteria bacterium RIFCSPHIGHO2_01_FULL_39_32]OGM38149.1 MAG: hypothetical protein A3F01_00680 [Candidatus Woesebacteria bacterium RIFCSPHIGHO2_12_FULL_38_11]OGM65378.1 MAG: hypothetical protein A2893_01470 [Candidatus Woesebacteria bacterium RIFCSPLOWO2_01_FULL_39_25]
MSNILVFGDSIAHGDYDSEGGWVDRLKRRLKAMFLDGEIADDIDVYNLCVDGDTSHQVLSRIKKETPQRVWSGQKTIFILSFVINDAILKENKPKVAPSVFLSNLNSIVKTARNYSNKIIFVGPNPVEESKVTPMPWSKTEFYYNDRISKYNEALMEFCNKGKVDYINLLAMFNKLNYKNLLYDGCHPNTQGHEIIFNIVKSFLQEKKYI